MLGQLVPNGRCRSPGFTTKKKKDHQIELANIESELELQVASLEQQIEASTSQRSSLNKAIKSLRSELIVAKRLLKAAHGRKRRS